jgi:hypothetical protein
MIITKGSNGHPGGHHYILLVLPSSQQYNASCIHSAITEDQNKATEKEKTVVNQCLDYAATNPNAIMQFHKSNMQLQINSNAMSQSMLSWKQHE